MDLGNIALIAALILSIYSIVAHLIGILKNRTTFFESGKIAIILISVLTTIASLWLFRLFLIRDFQTGYVAMYSSHDLPMFYTISAFWAGGSGSLLLWVWLISIYAAYIVFKDKYDALTKHAMPVILIIQVFLLYLLVMLSNPFDKLGFTPRDGQGLNPLLQDPGMFFHPSTLFLGYAGFVIPYAFMIAGLYLGNGDWIYRTRRWTMFSWLFLSLGNFFGSYWAYTVLGWGGYWAWDPVENASFMPWLTATAFFHSIMIQERKQGMKIWNVLLMLFTFELIIYGTLLTRSGIIDSIHSFGQSEIGPYFIWFMIAVLVSTLLLLALKYDKLDNRKIFESYVSREASFLFNNWIFVASVFAVFWGTTYPLVSDAVRGYRVSVGPSFYNEINAPLAVALVILMGVCPILAWRRASFMNLKKSYTYPLISGSIITIIVLLSGINSIAVLLVVFVCAFAVATHLLDFTRGVKKQKKLKDNGIIKNIANTILNNKRTYGGYIAHIAVILIILGVTFSSVYEENVILDMKIGGQYNFGEYTFKLNDIYQYTKANKEVTAAKLDIYKNGKKVGMAEPRMYYYLKQQDDFVKPQTYTDGFTDIYFLIQAFRGDSMNIKIKKMPLINLIWIGGGYILIIGTILALFHKVLPRRRRFI
ncbi:MAG: heme lyase CcmF/NrfE family subunit [Methanosarcinales archaeon]